MKELKGSEKQIKYATDILKETFRIIPQYSKWLDEQIQDKKENDEITRKMYAIDKGHLNRLIKNLKNEDDAGLIISSLKDILYTDTNRVCEGLEYGKWEIINREANYMGLISDDEIKEIMKNKEWIE